MSWTHYRKLIRIESPKARDSYLLGAVLNRWIVDNLQSFLLELGKIIDVTILRNVRRLYRFSKTGDSVSRIKLVAL